MERALECDRAVPEPAEPTLDPEPFREQLARAEANAHVGNCVPDGRSHPRLWGWLVPLAARVVRSLSRFLINPQRDFNVALTRSVRALHDALHDALCLIEYRQAERIAQLEKALARQERRVALLLEELLARGTTTGAGGREHAGPVREKKAG